MIDARKLDRRITFQRAAETQSSTTGAMALDFEAPAEAFERSAQRVDPRPSERFTSDQQVARSTTVWRVRDDSKTRTVTAHERWRIAFGAVLYDIKGVVPSADRGSFLDFTAEARADS